jgi:hypothetical protein
LAVSNAKEIQKPLLKISGIEEAEQGASAEEAEVEALQQQNLSSIDTSKGISIVSDRELQITTHFMNHYLRKLQSEVL